MATSSNNKVVLLGFLVFLALIGLVISVVVRSDSDVNEPALGEVGVSQEPPNADSSNLGDLFDKKINKSQNTSGDGVVDDSGEAYCEIAGQTVKEGTVVSGEVCSPPTLEQ